MSKGTTHEECRIENRRTVDAFKKQPKRVSGISTRHVGHAGELLVAFDFVARGHEAVVHNFPNAPYDVIAIVGGETLRVQVKTRFEPSTIIRNDKGAGSPRLRKVYSFLPNSAKGGMERYISSGVDVFAFVALDQRKVLYVPAKECIRSARFLASTFSNRAEGSLDRFLEERFLFS